MSSGLQADPDAARAAVMSIDEFGESGTKYLKLTERQKELNEFWAYYKVAEHDAKGTDWAGRPLMRREMRDMISRQRYIPPGFVDAGGDTLPMDFRRPAAPLGIVRTIVSRFTGLLFSHKRHPQIGIPGDVRTEDYVNGLLEYGGFWSTAMLFRNQGGAMGSACFGFKFVNSNCVFEALDPRWCTPEFVGQGYQELSKLTIQYTYSKEEYDELAEKHKRVWYWYRRVIDTETDTLWVPVKCKEHGKEPPWDYIKKNTIQHGFGEIPYEWVQNTQSDDDVDGDPDAVGCYDMVRVVDQLLSEVWSGTIANCDPTLTMITDMDLNAIKKGSDNAIRLNQGSSAQYLELGGNGPRTGLEVAKAIEERIFRLAQCVPDNVLYESNGEKTATEIERIFSSMLEKADMIRGQYGPAITRMCEKLIRAAKIIATVRELEDGRLVRGKINVPPRTVTQPDGDVVELPRVVGNGTACVISWPPYYRASFMDIQTAVNMTTQAKDAEVLTKESAIRYIAPLMGIDPLKEIISLKRAEDAAQEAEAASAEEEPAEEEPEKADAAAWKTALDTGLCTINEYRENVLMLGALPDGDLTLPQYRASHSELFVAANAVMSPQAANQVVSPPNPDEKLAQGKRARDELSGGAPTDTPAPSGTGGKAPGKGAKGSPPGRAASGTSK